MKLLKKFWIQAHELCSPLEHTFGDINNPNRRTEKLGWFAWMDMDIEELAAEKKRDNSTAVCWRPILIWPARARLAPISGVKEYGSGVKTKS